MRLEWEDKVETEREKNDGKSKVKRNQMKNHLRTAGVDYGLEISINGKELSFCTFFFFLKEYFANSQFPIY